ncbi:hypothetical protein [Microcoleus sp. S13C4]|uniref:hypothetical protein n=1 Tax=Microcoleus sp. S13C4 TaxID=3055410 RepID=UPI002FCEBA58
MKEEGRRKREEGRRKREEGRRKKKEGRKSREKQKMNKYYYSYRLSLNHFFNSLSFFFLLRGPLKK